jgi:hypothetical protein
MFTAACHCGAVHLEIPRKPRQLSSCNCSLCRRYGALWAYYKARDVKVCAARNAVTSYSWGHKAIEFVRCATCGCVTHWNPVKAKKDSRMGVNARNLEPDAYAGVRVRHLDGASTWKYLD